MVNLDDVRLTLTDLQEQVRQGAGLIMEVQLPLYEPTVLGKTTVDDAAQEVDVDVAAREHDRSVTVLG